MENALTTFMKDVSDSLGLITVEKDSPIVYMVPDPEEDGYISEPLLSSKSLTFLQPYLSNTRKLIEVKDGKPSLVSLPFNPMTEDSIKSETEAFRAMRNRITYKLRLSVYELGYLLISYLQDDCREIKEHKIHKTAALGEFLENSVRANTKNVKKIVDDDTFKAWQKLCIGSGNKKIENRKSVLEVNVVRSKTIGKQHFNKLAAVYFPLFEELAKADRTIDNTINGVKLRNKDLEVFTAIFETVTRVCELEDYTYKVGSNDPEYSSFVALYSAYLQLISNMRDIADRLKVFGEGDVFELLTLQINLTPESLGDKLDLCTELLKNIPTERSLLLGETPEEHKEEVTTRPKLEKAGIATFGRQPNQQPSSIPVQQPQPVEQYNNPYVAPAIVQPHQQPEMSINDKAAAMFGSYSHNGGMYPVTPGQGQAPYGSLLKNVVNAISTGNASAINLAPQPQQGYMVVPQQQMVPQGYNNFPVAQAYYPVVNNQMQPPMNMMGQQPMGMYQPQVNHTPSPQYPTSSNNFSLFK